MKRFLALLLTSLMLFSVCSCDNGGNTATETDGILSTQEETTTEETQTKDISTESPSITQVVTEERVETEEKTASETLTETETDEEIVEEKKTVIKKERDMERILDQVTIIKSNYNYAYVDKERILQFSEEDKPFVEDGNAFIPVSFLKQFPAFTVKEGTTQRNGIDFVPVSLLTGAICGHFDEDTGLIIISDSRLSFFNDSLETQFIRAANNLLSIGRSFSAKMTGDRPILFETDESLKYAKAMAEQKVQPYYGTWLNIRSRANTALITGAAPDTGKSATQYRLAACKDLINARYLALAYYYTDDTRYLDSAVSFLMAYAEPMLGTDKYLDYSAPTTDGQADIGLNIAAPLTAACEVYSLLYPYMEEDDRVTFENWVREEADLCVKGHEFWIDNGYYGKQYGNNHLSSHLMGILAAAYVLEDDELLSYAMDPEKNEACLSEMITRAILMDGDEVYSADIDSNFTPGEVYDRYRSVQNNGFGYAMYHLKFLTYSALMLHHNGIDLFNYIGNNGENLLLSFRIYSDYLIQNDITLHGGHYTNDKGLNRENAYSMYSVAYYLCKDETVKSVLDAFMEQNVSCNEIEVLGVSAPYVFGISD